MIGDAERCTVTLTITSVKGADPTISIAAEYPARALRYPGMVNRLGDIVDRLAEAGIRAHRAQDVRLAESGDLRAVPKQA